jgi:hypothetical protein
MSPTPYSIGRLEIDDQLEPRRLFDEEVSWVGSLEDLSAKLAARRYSSR